MIGVGRVAVGVAASEFLMFLSIRLEHTYIWIENRLTDGVLATSASENTCKNISLGTNNILGFANLILVMIDHN